MVGATQGLGARVAKSVVQQILSVYPPSLRQRHGREMFSHFMEMGRAFNRQAPRTGWIRLIVLAVLDTARRAPQEWLADRHTSRRSPRSGWRFEPGNWRRAFRVLRRRPGFTAACLLTLTLGIGANTLIFTLVNGVLLRPMPYDESDRLVVMWQTNENWRNASNPTLRAFADRFPLSYPVYRDWTELPRAFQSLGTYAGLKVVLTGRGPATTLYGARLTHEVFDVLRVQPLLGRTFNTSDDRVGAERTAVISEGAWRTVFGQDTSVIGSPVLLDGIATRIVGVMPSSFTFPDGGDIWAPIEDADRQRPRDSQFLTAIARLRGGWTIERAREDMERVTRAIRTANVGDQDNVGFNMQWYEATVVGDVRGALFVLLGAVGVVLLIGCVNIANLFLVQARSREHELAVRAALGASRWRLVQDVWRETWLITGLGGALGVGLATVTLQPMLGLLPRALPGRAELHMDWRVLAFAVASCTVVALVVSLIPMMRIARTDPSPALSGSRGGSTRRESVRFHGMLVVTEVALAFSLVLGAMLLARELRGLLSTPIGFEPEGALTARISLPDNTRTQDGQVMDFFRRVADELQALPGVLAVGGSSSSPFSGSNSSTTIQFQSEAGQDTLNVAREVVFGGYFAALGLPILQGQTTTSALAEGASRPVVVNRNFAEGFWPDDGPIGHTITYRGEPYTIAGVVADVRHVNFADSFRPRVYFPLEILDQDGRSQNIIVRAGVPPVTLVSSLRDAVYSVDRDVPVESIASLADQVSQRAASPRFYTLLIAAFAGLAAVLALVGISGVLSYSVVQRRAEIGIRMALGASRIAILRAVVGRGITLAAIGLVLGLGLGAAGTRALTLLMDDVRFLTPSVLVAATVLLAGMAVAASAVPALRAARVDPRTALTSDA
jgi:predicted permease